MAKSFLISWSYMCAITYLCTAFVPFERIGSPSAQAAILRAFKRSDLWITTPSAGIQQIAGTRCSTESASPSRSRWWSAGTAWPTGRSGAGAPVPTRIQGQAKLGGMRAPRSGGRRRETSRQAVSQRTCGSACRGETVAWRTANTGRAKRFASQFM